MSSDITDTNLKEAGRCLLCKIPKCSASCAVHTDVPAAVKLFREGRADEAGELLFRNNPFAAITSRVCDWEKACFGHCVLNARKMPVNWHSIEAEIAATHLETAGIVPGEDNGRRVAVVGAGPAGITAAFRLREAGCAVTVIDSNDEIGGVLRYGIPEFRLDRRFIELYGRMTVAAGIGFRGGVRVGRDVSVRQLRKDYDAVLIAAGAAVPRRLNIPGEDNPDIIYALDYLKDPLSYKLGRKVLVIGGGNVTMDASRTAVRAGHETWVYYRKSFENMPANTQEVIAAREEGVNFRLFEVPVAIDGHEAVMRKCENVTGPDGRISTRMIEGSDRRVSFDSMLVAISASVDFSIFGEDTPAADASGWPVTGDDRQTSIPGVFVAGDFILGPATVVQAVASAKTAADGILKYLDIR